MTSLARSLGLMACLLTGVLIGGWTGRHAHPPAPSVSPEETRPPVTSSVAPSMIVPAATRFQNALRLASQRLENAAPSDRAALAEQLAFDLSDRDPVGAVEWAATLPPDVRGQALRTALQQCSWREPFQGLALLKRYPEAVTRQGCEALADAFPASQLPQALEWANTLPETATVAVAARLMSRWTEAQPQAVTEWLGQLEPGTSRDQLITAYAHSARTVQPDTALAWCAKISDPAARVVARADVFCGWSARDALAARRWLHSAGLPPADVASLQPTLDAAELGR